MFKPEITDQVVIYVGKVFLCKKFSKSENEERNISNPSKLWSKCFHFCIKRFGGGISRAVVKVVNFRSINPSFNLLETQKSFYYPILVIIEK